MPGYRESTCDVNSPSGGTDYAGYAAQTAETYPVPTSHEDIINLAFSYHPPSPGSGRKYETIREAAKYFAKVILANTPSSADQTSAIRKLREVVMTANASIALNGIGL